MKNLCFSGGGIKGITYIGVYKYLLEENLLDNLENLSGTSVGALMCLCINLKYTPGELEVILKKLDYNSLSDLNIKCFLSNRYSIDSGNKIKYFIKKIINSKGIDEKITFAGLYEKTKIGLYICSTFLNNCSGTIFNHKDTPDMEVYKACKFSLTIPFLWDIGTIEQDYYIDGCFSKNLPIEHFQKEDTVGFFCKNKQENVGINNIKDYTLKIINCLLLRANLYEIQFYKEKGYDIKTICLPFSVQNLDCNLSQEQRKLLVKLGYDSMNLKEKYT